ncbi:phospholipase [Thalassotalea sp. LPB0316]|uniref:phospholipase D-like domain-containing protein n=1 Tax=Thalassotalea sp. LPB0316 TaxID=2769490 RepID=UPI001866F3E3|nr:phospholipase D-like domain-containing protein [Thalassotalea sp. LPB0316]QOL27175.1 phospholipase [Thalassotalea sp. LPB0316]
MNKQVFLFTLLLSILLGGCSTTSTCEDDASSKQCVVEPSVSAPEIDDLYYVRTIFSQSKLKKSGIDPIKLALDSKTPVNSAQAKILGLTTEDSIRSIATKIWMIENAEHTIDATYYIFARDLIGNAMLGAFCNAVKRGVDVRLMVDSIGSYGINHGELKALKNCEQSAGYMKNSNGELTTRKARVQIVIFNALSKVFVNVNRRSHDKMLVVDAAFPDKAMVITGGRNVSLDYYGITTDGKVNKDTFKDLEILLKTGDYKPSDLSSLGAVSQAYMSILYLNRGNKQITSVLPYYAEQIKAQNALSKLKGFELFDKYYQTMPEFIKQDFKPAQVRLAHELGNLESTDVVENRVENLNSNPNSIVALLKRNDKESEQVKHLKIVSPYLFLAEYKTPTGKVIMDEREDLYRWLDEDPERTIEIITNSVLTSDNFFTQAMIDQDMAPRLLMTPDMVKVWQDDWNKGEFNADFINSQAYLDAISNPRIKIYQIGKLDSDILGGESVYGKLHAKFMFSDSIGFIGTTNLDYRSRLYNNEMGFFFAGDELRADLVSAFDQLKANAYLWGTPQWLEMRKQLIDVGGLKGRSTKRQRKIYTDLIRTGLKWQF